MATEMRVLKTWSVNPTRQGKCETFMHISSSRKNQTVKKLKKIRMTLEEYMMMQTESKMKKTGNGESFTRTLPTSKKEK